MKKPPRPCWDCAGIFRREQVKSPCFRCQGKTNRHFTLPEPIILFQQVRPEPDESLRERLTEPYAIEEGFEYWGDEHGDYRVPIPKPYYRLVLSLPPGEVHLCYACQRLFSLRSDLTTQPNEFALGFPTILSELDKIAEGELAKRNTPCGGEKAPAHQLLYVN
jgi:hypothetical protein